MSELQAPLHEMFGWLGLVLLGGLGFLCLVSLAYCLFKVGSMDQ